MPIPVTLYSDFVCPWCFFGERKLSMAIARLGAPSRSDRVQVDITYRPFKLNPGTPPEGWARRQYRVAKFGTWDRSLVLDEQVSNAGRAVGLAFNYDQVERTPNTTLAHRLMWAASQDGGDLTGLARRLFSTYFTQGLDLSDHAVLRQVARDSGLSADRTDAVLDGDLGAAAVRALTDEAAEMGINGVPLFQIGSEALAGAQPVEVLEAAVLREAALLQDAAGLRLAAE